VEEAREGMSKWDPDKANLRETARESFWRGMGQGNGGAMALPLLIVAGSLTLGVWLVWLLVLSSPTLFAETTLDGPLAARDRDLADTVTIRSWWKNAFAGTAGYFIALAVVAMIVGATLECWVDATPAG
jgi:hypothetical protein